MAKGETVIAAGVESPVPTESPVPHITLAVNRAEGGSPKHAQTLTNWEPIKPLELEGRVEEVD